MPTVLDAQELTPPAVLIFNPNAGEELRVSTNAGGAEEAQEALQGAGIPFDAWPTEHQGHATELARAAVAEGRKLAIAAGGDGTMVND
jgi:diacylglycerol kinase family enzyme